MKRMGPSRGGPLVGSNVDAHVTVGFVAHPVTAQSGCMRGRPTDRAADLRVAVSRR